MVSKSEAHFHMFHNNSEEGLVDCNKSSFLGIRIVMGD